MAHTVISVKLPPNIDPTKARLAYGDRALPKLVSMIICISKYLRSKVRNEFVTLDSAGCYQFIEQSQSLLPLI